MNNKKKLFLGIAGVGLLGLVGAGAGLLNNVNAVETKAAAGDILSGYQLVGAGLGIGWNDESNDAYRFTEQADGSYKWTGPIAVERFRVTAGDGKWETKLNNSNIGDNCGGIFVAASSVTTDGDNNIWCTTAGNYTITLNAAKTTLDFAVAEDVVYHSVTKYAVVNGTKEGEPMSDPEELVEGSHYGVPGRVNRSGYHFGGWFTNEACTSAYVAADLNADLVLYAKYTTLSKDSYIYYITDTSTATNNMIHTWGGDVEYANKNVLITGIVGVQEVHGVTRFRNTNYLIYKIPFSSESEDTGFNFHYNNWQTQSTNKTLVAGNAYQWDDGGIATDEVAGGDALDFILEFEGIRNAVAAGTGIKAYSICGISAANASSLCSKYNGLSGTARGYVDASYTYTYKKDDASVNDNVTFYDMMEELAKKAGGVALNGHAASWSGVSAISSETNNGVIIALIAAAVATVAVGGAIMIRRRKEN